MLETLGWGVSSTGIFVRTAMRTPPPGCLLVGRGRSFLIGPIEFECVVWF